MLINKNVKNIIKELVGSKVVIYVDDYMDSRGIEKFTIDKSLNLFSYVIILS